jgi:hypothetical protein
MNRSTLSALSALTIVAFVAFTNCKKETPPEAVGVIQNRQETEIPGVIAPTTDRIDEIVKGLAVNNYSLHFSAAIPEAGITKTAYGADSYYAFADPQDLICPEPIRIKFKKVPVWRIPTYIPSTCPDMIIDINKLDQVRDLLLKADPVQYNGLKEVKFVDGGGLVATSRFTGQYAKASLDKMDDLFSDLKPDSYVLMNGKSDLVGGFTRSFYGYADLNNLVFRPYRINLKDILKPRLKGCFDPIVLNTIRERLQKVDPVTFGSLNVTQLAQNKNIGVLSAQ